MRELISRILIRYPKFSEAVFKYRQRHFTVEIVGRRFSTTRFTMYNSIETWLKKHPIRGKVLLVSERDEHSIRKILGDKCIFTITKFPETDIMKLAKLGENKFDVVVSDQVLEHVPNPFIAVAQIHKILKPGGLVISTSCSFNPIHDEPDYFRFTPAGFRQIHQCFSKILLLESWGNHRAISRFAGHGSVSFDVRKVNFEKDLATDNEEKWPWSVWCIARK